MDRPFEQLVATRKTEQALLQVIDAAIVSAFHNQFRRLRCRFDHEGSATERLIGRAGLHAARSQRIHGGGRLDRRDRQDEIRLPTARIYFPGSIKDEGFAGGKVHAKVAVC